MGRDEKPAAMIYDEGRSNIVRSLTGSEAFWVNVVSSRQEMEHEVSVSPSTLLGLVIPADFDQITDRGDPVALEGSYVHWADPEKIRLAKLPGSAMLNLFTASMAEVIPQGEMWANSAALLAATALLFGAVTWLVRRTDR
jgi:hypothetical protein